MVMDLLELIHDGDARPFACQVEGCHKDFARRSDLVRHMRIHSNDRPFQCDWPKCNRDFIQRSALTVHYRVHTGERPHRCEDPGCDKAFSDSSSLARHRRIHTGKRPYKCHVPLCSKTFCRKTTLTKHLKRNHGTDAASVGFSSRANFAQDLHTPSSEEGDSQSDYDDEEADYRPSQKRAKPPKIPRTPNNRRRYALRSESLSRAPYGWSEPVEAHHHYQSNEMHYYSAPPAFPATVQECDGVNCPFTFRHAHEVSTYLPVALPSQSHLSPSPQPGYLGTPAMTHCSSAQSIYDDDELPMTPTPATYEEGSMSYPLSLPTLTPAALPTDSDHSPIPRHRRASSASALDIGSMVTFSGNATEGLGLLVDDKPLKSVSYMDDFALPMTPSQATFRHRRGSSINFPGASSLPTIASRKSFSSFINQHIERMEEEAAQASIDSVE